MDFVQILLLVILAILVLALLIKFLLFLIENKQKVKEGFLFGFGFSLVFFTFYVIIKLIPLLLGMLRN